MSTTVPTQHYRIEERMAADGQITALHVLGHVYDGDPELAWLKFVHETHRHHYGPYGLRRLVLLGGAR